MGALERRAETPPEFRTWKPRIPSVYGRGFERAKNTSFSLGLDRFVPQPAARFRLGPPHDLQTPGVVVLTTSVLIGGL